MEDFSAHFDKCDIVLVVPPFSDVFQGNLACHLLQACAAQVGHKVRVVYGNILFAALIGRETYRALLKERTVLEAVFSEKAFGAATPPARESLLDTEALQQAAAATDLWLSQMARILGHMSPRIIGSTSSFEQITSSIALLKHCKERFPHVTTIIGGANCEDEMSQGLRSTGAPVDHVFSGESEKTFVAFLNAFFGSSETLPETYFGSPCTDMDALPLAEFEEFFEQEALFFGGPARGKRGLALPQESSRGCWWGEKHHCTFCGLNGGGMAFREKSEDRFVAEINAAFDRYPIRQINMVDNIMPHRYFRSVLSDLAATLPDRVTLFYEQKANISLDKAIALKNAKITTIQPGIESLNTHILTCMNKGTTAEQNIALLRYARTLGIEIEWNMITGFPGDRVEDYREMCGLLPKIAHLQPPDGVDVLRLDRFSPYHDRPEDFGITNIRPKQLYSQIFPRQTDLNKLAYYFDGDYHCGAFDDMALLRDIANIVEAWVARWEGDEKPVLAIVHLTGDQYVLVDTRAPDQEHTPQLITAEQVRGALHPNHDLTPGLRDWLLDHELVVALDGRLVPLCTASVAIHKQFERATVIDPALTLQHALADAGAA